METNVKYSESFYDAKRLKQWALRYLTKLPSDVHTLVSTGSSGVAIASAMMALSERPLTHWHVRKGGESAHDSHGGSYVKHRPKYCFVDDFISEGYTLEYVYAECETYEMPLSYVLVGHLEGKLAVELPPIKIIYVAPRKT